MKLLVVKKDRLDELTKFGFKKDGLGFYVYTEKAPGEVHEIIVASWFPVLSVSEYDSEDFENSTVVSIPDVIMDLIEAGMVERYEDI